MVDFQTVWAWARPALPLVTGVVVGATPCLAALLLAGGGVAILAAAGTFRHGALGRDFLALTVAALLVLPPVVASGDPVAGAWPAVAAWWLTFAMGTLVLHTVESRAGQPERSPQEGVGPFRWAAPADPQQLQARARQGRIRWAARAASAGVLAGSLGAALGVWGPPGWAGPAAALILPSLAGLALSVPRVHPRYLERLGWTLVGVEVVTLVLLVQGG